MQKTSTRATSRVSSRSGESQAAPYVALTPLLLFGSGLCALVYQVAWQREFRLIFGVSTAATAAVLGIFIGGLGLGGILLGRRAENHPQPLRMYALLEVGIALTAALTPVLLWLVRLLYLGTGGSQTLGLFGGTLLRLILAALVLAIPTVLMGGTLPAAAKYFVSRNDRGRRALALLYGINTLGAVAGCAISTFWWLELLGTHGTLWAACALNLLVAVTALVLSGKSPALREKPSVAAEEPAAGKEKVDAALLRFTLIAAGLAGFAFFLMEIVWYRMLAPILGGSIFTFGLILGIALLGIGLGGLAYAFLRSDRPATVQGFALSCMFEALAIAIPFAMGDQVAVLALLLRELSPLGFGGLILNWTLITMLVVFPAAFISGIQFPLLIGMLGEGRADVARQTGLTYGANTLGAIAGSLAGGFGLLPLLTAPGCWKFVGLMLVVLGLAAAVLAQLRKASRSGLLVSAVTAALICFLFARPGPSAAWRHSAIGVGQDQLVSKSRNGIERFLRLKRRAIEWQAEGVESGVALDARMGYALIVNGKNDSNIKMDAATTIMSGVLGAILNPTARHAMIVGLGTGNTAGWMGKIHDMERVDVVELEPAIVEVARKGGAATQDVVSNPKVNIIIGDAREVLLASRNKYDIIFSEPSNPYRAGIASLFTKEYYEAAVERLNENGLFIQWVQAYEVDAETIMTIYATLGSVFPNIETWQVHPVDMLLVASKEPIEYDAQKLRARIAEAGIKEALATGWRAWDLEGVLAHRVAGNSLAERMKAKQGNRLNTDDRTRIEFGFARSIGSGRGMNVMEIRELVRQWPDTRPSITGNVNWERVDDEQSVLFTTAGMPPPDRRDLTPPQRSRLQALLRFGSQNYGGAMEEWRRQERAPASPTELAVVGLGLAEMGDGKAEEIAAQLEKFQPAEAGVIRARMALRQNRVADAAQPLSDALVSLRENPWPMDSVMQAGLDAAIEISEREPRFAPQMFDALKQPFAVSILNESRLNALLRVAGRVDPQVAAREAWEPLEPNVPWQIEYLSARARTYEAARHPLQQKAARELQQFLVGEGKPLAAALE